MVLISRGSEVGGGDHRTDVGTVVRIAQVTPRGDQRFALVAEGVRRLRVVEWLEDDPYPQALIEELPPDAEAPDGVLAGAEASVRRLRSLLSELGRVPALPHDIDFGATTDETGLATLRLGPPERHGLPGAAGHRRPGGAGRDCSGTGATPWPPTSPPCWPTGGRSRAARRRRGRRTGITLTAPGMWGTHARCTSTGSRP